MRDAWVFLPGASCPPDAPPKNQPDTDAPLGCVHRVVAPNDPLHPDASFPPDAPPKNQPTIGAPLGCVHRTVAINGRLNPPCAIGIRYSLFHYLRLQLFTMDRGTLFPADTLSDSKAFTGQKNALSVWDMQI